jgi:hypothetical protein
MSSVQSTLFDELQSVAKKPSLVVSKPIPVSSDSDDLIASGKGIIWPCHLARRILIGEERCEHIRNCSMCRDIKQRLDESIGMVSEEM